MIVNDFLPQDFDPSAPIALLAGKGDYPCLVWQKMKALCSNAFVIAFEENSLQTQVPPDHFFKFSVGQIGTWLKALKTKKIRYVVLAGQVTPRRLFNGLLPDLKAILLLAKLKERNATSIFTAVINEMASIGITTLDARSFVVDQLVDFGDMTQKNGRKIDPEKLAKAVETCKTIASLDIGQSLIVSDGTVVIVEAFDGTDAMIERAGKICSKPMGLGKLAKASQDFRFDVPVFGMHTLDEMHRAGVVWAALDTQRALIINKQAVLHEADRLKIRIFGI